MKDISVYNMLGLSPSQIYIVGRPSKKYQNQCQVAEGSFGLPVVFHSSSSTPTTSIFSPFFAHLLPFRPISRFPSLVSVPERGLRGPPLHAAVRTQSAAQEVPVGPHGAEERLVRPLRQARLPVQAHSPAEDDVGPAARPAVCAQPQTGASPEPAGVGQGPRRGKRGSRAGCVGTSLHAPRGHHALTPTPPWGEFRRKEEEEN